MMGGDLPSNDAWTTSLLTNPEVIAVDQHTTSSRPVITTDKAIVWVSRSDVRESPYLAIFNSGTRVVATVQYSWKDLGFEGPAYRLEGLVGAPRRGYR